MCYVFISKNKFLTTSVSVTLVFKVSLSYYWHVTSFQKHCLMLLRDMVQLVQ
jgi:hypothetical protein